MPSSEPKPGRKLTEATRAAAAAARKARSEDDDAFGLPELFVVKADERTFIWELRRFGGIVLQRGPGSFRTTALARADGEQALAKLLTSADLPTFNRQLERRGSKLADS